jgi:hypothetical protein
MAAVFASGIAADIILVVIALEALWLRLRQRWQLVAILCRLMPGALMMVALRAALTGQAWPWIALPLTLSFPFHLADLRFGPGWRTKK